MKFLSVLILLAGFSYIIDVSASTAEQNCVSCHQQAVSAWGKSDHAKAMAVADKTNVLGNFSGVQVSHYSQHATFFTKDASYWITLTEGAKTQNYQVKYTFGHYPLQQYLIEQEVGKLQVFPFAWDARTKQEGGQRWYPNYPAEDIQANDRLHWQQPLQNWNGMCADCHSDGLKRNYTVADDSFATNWDNINVGCQSCHGDMQNHIKAKQTSNKNVAQLSLSKQEQVQIGHWLRGTDDKVAH